MVIITTGIIIISFLSLIIIIRKIYSTAGITSNKTNYKLVNNNDIKEYLLTTV